MVIDKEGNVTGFYGGYPYSAIVSVVVGILIPLGQLYNNITDLEV